MLFYDSCPQADQYVGSCELARSDCHSQTCSCQHSSCQRVLQSRSSSPPAYSRALSHPYPSTLPSKCHTSSSPHKPSFQTGPDTFAPAVCTLCLGRHPDLSKCTEKKTWDGKPTHCQQGSNGCLINPKNKSICMDFNFQRGCQYVGTSHQHECSGCGSLLHGASKCPQAQM